MALVMMDLPATQFNRYVAANGLRRSMLRLPVLSIVLHPRRPAANALTSRHAGCHLRQC